MTLFQRALLVFVLFGAAALPAWAQPARTERFQNHQVVAQEIIVRFRSAENAETLSQTIRRQDSDIDSSSPIGRSGAIRLRSKGRSVEKLIEAYSRRTDVEYVEPNYVWKANDIPNDSSFGDQWALRNTGQTVGQQGVGKPGADIKASLAWDVTEGTRGVVVGMIDTGIDYNHPDLVGNVWSAPAAFSVTVGGQVIQCAAGTHGFNSITRTCDPADNQGHGTHTAGIAGASGNNFLGVSGVSRVANIMALKFLDNTGQGTTANAIDSIEFAIQVKKKFPASANVRVLNASWGQASFSQALLDEINVAGANDILFVTAAGNSSDNADTNPEYPASYHAANLITVASTNNTDGLSSFSNYGPTTVHLGAPGEDILSTYWGFPYSTQSGTSASTPMVSGAAALILSACPLSTSDLKSTILSTVDVVPGLQGMTVSNGRLNVNSAIRQCAGSLPASFTLSVSPSAQIIAFGSGDQYSVSVNPLNGFASPIAFAATNVPAGMTINFAPGTVSNETSLMSIALDPGFAQGTYYIEIQAAGGGVTRNTGIAVTAGLPSTCVVNPPGAFKSGMLETGDASSLHRAPAFAEYCSFTLNEDRAVLIQLLASSFNGYLYLMTSTGTVIASDNTGAHNGAELQITLELVAGTYFIEITTGTAGESGDYFLHVNLAHPQITSVSPNTGVQGTSVDITIIGTVFFGSPFTVKVGNVSNCVGVSVSNVNVVSSTKATATLTLPNNTALCTIAVSNPGGSSDSGVIFQILPLPPTITLLSPSSGVQGQFIPVTITGTNFVSSASVLFGSFPVSSNVVNSTTITVGLNLIGALPGDIGFTVQTSGGTSNSVPFTVLLAPPRLNSMFPVAAGPGLSVDVSLFGGNFATPFQINIDPRIGVTNVKLVSPSRIDATLTAASSTPFGVYPITISTQAGTTAPINFMIAPPPAIASYSPDHAYIGENTIVTLTGTNLFCTRVATLSGTGVNVADVAGSSNPCADPTTAMELIQVTASAPVGPRTLTITSPNGVSNPITINVLRPPPAIQSITPLYGAQGTSVAITLNGANLSSGSVSVSGTGVQVGIVNNSSATTLTATLTIAANATVGARNVTVTTIDGTSNAAVFSVTPPAWPDFNITQTLPAKTAGGFNEVFALNVRNDGEKENLVPVTVTNTWSLPAVNLVSASPGWACSTAGTIVTCTSPNPIAPHTVAAISLTIAMPAVEGFFTNTVAVTSVEDYNVANNSATKDEEIVEPPNATLVSSPGTILPGQQGTLSISLTAPFFHDITGTLNTVSLTFSPTTPGISMDPATQFATGGQQVSYIIRANALQAEFQGIPGPIGFQAGTVAGFLHFSATYKAGTNTARTLTALTTVATAAPVLNSVSSDKNATGFSTSITLLSSTKEIRNLVFQFNTSTPIQMSCGGIAGCTASGATISFNLTSVFSTWYAGNPAYGSLAILRVPFTVQGSLAGSISVTMTNSVGSSNTMTFAIP